MSAVTVIQIPVIEEAPLTYVQWLKMIIEQNKARIIEAEEGIAWWTEQLEQAQDLRNREWAKRGLAQATKNREAWLRHIAEFEADLAEEENK